MRLLKHLSEEVMTQEKWLKMEAMISKDCKPFLRDFKGAKHVLWRGLKGSAPDTITKKMTRTNREPRFLSKSLSNMLSSYSKSEWGWDTRKEGLFVTASDKLARQYGLPVIVIPIGQYKVVWNDDVQMLYGHYDDWDWLVTHEADDIYNELKHIKTTNDMKHMSKKLKAFDKEMKRLDFQPTKDLPTTDMIYAHAEDIIFDHYFKRHLDNYTVGNMNKYLKTDSSYYYTEAIIKCKEYYMIPSDWKGHIIGAFAK